MWVTLERPMALGSIRYWDVSTTALTPPSAGSFSCSTEMEMSRQAPRGRSVCQRLGTERSPQSHPCCPALCSPCSPLLEVPPPQVPPCPHRSTTQSLRGWGAMLSVT